MWGQAGDLHFNIPEITVQRGDSGQMSRKRPQSLDERNKQENLERERGTYLANQIGNKKGVKMEQTEVESQKAGSMQGMSWE